MPYRNLFFLTLVVACLLLGTTTYFYLDHASLAEQLTGVTEERDAALGKSATAEENAKKLQSKLNLLAQSNTGNVDTSQLSQVIDEKDAEITRLKKALEQAGSRGNGRNMRLNMRERMEKLKQENPERYEQIQTRMQNFRQQMQEREEKREQYVKNIDMSRLNDDQKELVANFQNLTKTQQELRANMANGNVDFREMMDTDRQVNQMSAQIRDILIDQYAGSSAEEIKNIVNATTNQGPMGPPPPPPGN